jgi:hypothetical protein
MLDINIYEVVGTIQAEIEGRHIVPALATFREVKEAVGNIDDKELHALLNAECICGLIRRVRTINGYAYEIAEQ